MTTTPIQSSMQKFQQYYHKHKISRWVWCVVILMITILILTPMFWMVRVAFTPESELFNWPPKSIVKAASIKGFISLFTERLYFFRYYLNSLIVAVMTTAVCLASGVLAGYSFSRFRYKGRIFLMKHCSPPRCFPGRFC